MSECVFWPPGFQHIESLEEASLKHQTHDCTGLMPAQSCLKTMGEVPRYRILPSESNYGAAAEEMEAVSLLDTAVCRHPAWEQRTWQGLGHVAAQLLAA